jgi:hypothetical protein
VSNKNQKLQEADSVFDQLITTVDAVALCVLAFVSPIVERILSFLFLFECFFILQKQPSSVQKKEDKTSVQLSLSHGGGYVALD